MRYLGHLLVGATALVLAGCSGTDKDAEGAAGAGAGAG